MAMAYAPSFLEWHSAGMLCTPLHTFYKDFFFTYTVYTSVASVGSSLFLFLFRAVAPPAYMKPSFIVLLYYIFCNECKQVVDKRTGVAKVCGADSEVTARHKRRCDISQGDKNCYSRIVRVCAGYIGLLELIVLLHC